MFTQYLNDHTNKIKHFDTYQKNIILLKMKYRFKFKIILSEFHS